MERCPYCDATDIVDHGTSSDGNGKVTYTMLCNVCGEMWEETDG